MNKTYFSFLLLCGALLVSCGNKSESEIKELAESGVVLVQNKSFYEVELPNGNSLYFAALDDEGDINGLTFDRDSVEYSISYGTGFFVSNEGQIATNAHVVSSQNSDKEINKSMTNIINALKSLVSSIYSYYSNEYDQMAAQCSYDERMYYYSFNEYYLLEYYIAKDRLDKINDELKEARYYYDALSQFRASDTEIKYHNEVSIAYNNTFVTNENDFIPCVVSKVDADHDLAIIQLKNKKTPDDRSIFPIPKEDPLETYTFMENLTKKIKEDKNSKLFMTGFNLGPILALTDEGIKSQFNSGSISQTQGDKLMYSIPALPGSSGSPVVNLQGELVAVNFAGINGAQNFNYGIRVRYLRELLEK